MEPNITPFEKAKIKVFGVGGGGCNAVSRMVQMGIQGAEFYLVNTDAQSLSLLQCPNKIQIGSKLTRGLGCGGEPEVGAKAAEESKEELRQAVSGADMVFITCGMGGGTGTGAAPVIAELSKSTNPLTIGIVTKPFRFEGSHRAEQAEAGIGRMADKADTFIVVPNDRLLDLCDRKVGVEDAFKMADDTLRQGVAAITEVITKPGQINLDFADVRAIMRDSGPAWLATAKGQGQNRAVTAAKTAIASPMLEMSLEGAKSLLFVVTGGNDLTLHEVSDAATTIQQVADPSANIIFGVRYDQAMRDEVSLVLVATGFKNDGRQRALRMEQWNVPTARNEAELEVPTFLRAPVKPRASDLVHRDSAYRTVDVASIGRNGKVR